jgi:hypothetical protein
MYIAEWKSKPESQNIVISAELTVGVQKSFRAELFRIGISRLIVDHGPEIESHSVKKRRKPMILTRYWGGPWCLR